MAIVCMVFSRYCENFKLFRGTSLAVQWLRLCASSEGGSGSIPGQGTRSHMPQPRAHMP